MVVEGSAEVGRVFKSAVQGNLSNLEAGIPDQIGGFLQPFGLKIFGRTLPVALFEIPVEGRHTSSCEVCQFGNAQVVVQIGRDDFIEGDLTGIVQRTDDLSSHRIPARIGQDMNQLL